MKQAETKAIEKSEPASVKEKSVIVVNKIKAAAPDENMCILPQASKNNYLFSIKNVIASPSYNDINGLLTRSDDKQCYTINYSTLSEDKKNIIKYVLQVKDPRVTAANDDIHWMTLSMDGKIGVISQQGHVFYLKKNSETVDDFSFHYVCKDVEKDRSFIRFSKTGEIIILLSAADEQIFVGAYDLSKPQMGPNGEHYIKSRCVPAIKSVVSQGKDDVIISMEDNGINLYRSDFSSGPWYFGDTPTMPDWKGFYHLDHWEPTSRHISLLVKFHISPKDDKKLIVTTYWLHSIAEMVCDINPDRRVLQGGPLEVVEEKSLAMSASLRTCPSDIVNRRPDL